MVSETPNKETALLPERHPQREFFICDVADAVLKDDMASMEHPVFALAKQPDFAVQRYEHNDKVLRLPCPIFGVSLTAVKIRCFAYPQLISVYRRP